MTFNDDDRFAAGNIIYGDEERVSHNHVRDLDCKGCATHVEGQSICVGDNVEANFKGKGNWYPAHVTKMHRGKYDLQYAGGDHPKPVTVTRILTLDFTLNLNQKPEP